MKRTLTVLLFVVLLFLCAVAYGGETQSGDSSLRISEIMASNHVSLEDMFGLYPDWIEIHNTSDTPISLQGVCLSDKWSDLARFMFPDDAVIQPDEYLVVFASGVKTAVADEYHMPFKLKASGELIILSQGGILLDSIAFNEQQSDISYALDSTGEYQFTITPTPHSVNLIN